MFFISLLLAGTASASCLHGVFKREEGEVQIPKFGYEGTFGPLNWAGLAPENEACRTGKNQSPINIDSTITLATEKPIIEIPKQAVEFENLNTTIEVIMNGTTTFGGSKFAIAQFHVHTPSEHRINREYSPLEVHVVHRGIDDPTQLVVLALMFELCTNASDPLIASIAPHLEAIKEPGSKTAIEAGVDFSGVLANLATSNIFQYSGSLTTPPCSEGVTFLAVETPLRINVPDFNAIKKIVKFNSRVNQNTLGQENIVMVGCAASSSSGNASAVGATQLSPPAAEETPAGEGYVAGSPITVTEISGVPMPTPLVGVAQNGMRFRK